MSRARVLLRQVARAVSPPCNDLSLQQRGGTCYMAAATLLFGRTVLPYVTSASLRRYVRLSMANRWDDAVGPRYDSTCPRIPVAVREYYSELYTIVYDDLRRPIGEKHYDQKDMRRPALGAIRVGMIEGGGAPEFLASLFWAAELPCRLTRSHLSLTPDGRFVRDTRASPLESMKHAFARMDASIPFTILDFFSNTGLAMGDFDFVDALISDAYTHLSSRRYAVLGLLVGMDTADRSRGHVISLFPCLESWALEWAVCNTQDGRGCSFELRSMLEYLHKWAKYDRIGNLVFVLQRVAA